MDAQGIALDMRHLRSLEPTDTLTIHQLTKLCADLQKDVITLQCQVLQLEQLVNLSRNDVGNLYQGMDSLIALRETLDAVFTDEAPAAVCPSCGGVGSHNSFMCEKCYGTGEVQS